jgi:hypothetical protein
MMFREKITVYSENHVKHINALCRQNASSRFVKAGDVKRNDYLKT